MIADGALYGQDLAWLKQLQVELRSAISAVVLAKSYTINGRQVTRENLIELQQTLSSVSIEIQRQTDVSNGVPGASAPARVVYADFSKYNSQV